MENKQTKIKKEEPPVTMDGFMEEFQKFRSELEIIRNIKSNPDVDIKDLNKLMRKSNKLMRDLKKLEKETPGKDSSKKKSPKKD